MRPNPLVRPGEFFARGAPSAPGAAVIAVGSGAVAVASAVPAVRGQNPEFSLETVLAGVLVGGAIGGLAVWALVTLVAHVLTVPVDGFGPVTRTGVFVGWGLAPLFVVNAVTTGLVWWYAWRGGLGADGTLPQPAATLSLALGALGALWLGYVLTYAIKEGRNVATRHAAVIAGAVVVVQLAYAVGSVL